MCTLAESGNLFQNSKYFRTQNLCDSGRSGHRKDDLARIRPFSCSAADEFTFLCHPLFASPKIEFSQGISLTKLAEALPRPRCQI